MISVKKLKDIGNTVAGGAIGAVGSLGGALGSNPQRKTVPAYQYGQKNKSFGRGYNATSTPGKVVAQAEHAGVNGVKSVMKKLRGVF
jgi:hypothetical protein